MLEQCCAFFSFPVLLGSSGHGPVIEEPVEETVSEAEN